MGDWQVRPMGLSECMPHLLARDFRFQISDRRFQIIDSGFFFCQGGELGYPALTRQV
jgi:hypothetical protein